MSAPTPPLTFVLAPAAALEADTLSHEELERVQALGVCRAAALRIFAAGRQPLPEPADLPLDGRLGGPGPGGSSGLRCICDATIPDFEPARLWLGVYGPADADGERWQQLDRFALGDAANETCWFYPTHDGAFLSWQRNLALQLAPARIVDPPPGLPAAYDRGQIAVLWSLLADDTTLTCVGLTYAGCRIDWPPGPITWQPTATWSSFVVDSRAETPLTVQQRWVTPQDLPVAAAPSARR